VDIHHCLKGIFGDQNVFCYLAFIPTYPTGMWSFNYATKGAAHPLQGFDAAKSEAFAAEHSLQYYNVGMHQAAFALPTFVQTMLKG
jgi:spermidine synthase